MFFYANHEGWEAQARFGLRNGRWLGEPLGGGPVSMLHVSVHYGPRTLRYTLQVWCAADSKRCAGTAAHLRILEFNM